jgi:hypothetical protein
MYGGLINVARGDRNNACDPCPKAKEAKCPKKCDLCKVCDICGIFKKKTKCPETVKACPNGETHVSAAPMSDLPPNARPGECYAKVIIPAQFKTVTERHMIKEASERLEIIPAEYKWCEERVMAKEASTQLEEVPAEYRWTEKTVEVAPARTEWVRQSAEQCANPDLAVKGDIYCLRTTPAQYKTIRTQCLVRAAHTRCVTIPAEYQTVRRQVLARAASTRKVCIPAEYEDVTRSVMVCPERWKWEHVVCEQKMTTDAANKIKTALTASGYRTGPLNGQLDKDDWTALSAFQAKNGLGVGKLSYDTLKMLKVTLQ